MIDSIKLKIRDRDFILPVEYDWYSEEPVPCYQIDSFKYFLSHPEWLDKSIAKIEDFCREDVLFDENNKKKDNIFSYVKPEYLFVQRGNEQSNVVLICKYKYDMEHGLAVSFSHDGKILVGLQDDII